MAASDRTFRAMGSTAHVLAVGSRSDDLVEYAENRVLALERTWTRFDPSSELSRLNGKPGAAVEVGADLMALVERSVDAWHLTAGRFDPTLLASIEAAGYGPSTSTSYRPAALHSCDRLEIDRLRRTVTLPPGTGLDPGGIGKGLAADLVVAELLDAGAAGALVNLGGDLRLAGEAPDANGWSVAIEDPFDPDAVIAVLRIAEGGVATTTPDHRVWCGPDGNRRHLIDPTTGRPSTTDVASVTVIAGDAWMAEAVAKSAALAGFEAAVDLIDDVGLSGLVVSDRGGLALSSRMGAFL